jgi:hypothetical protein
MDLIQQCIMSDTHVEKRPECSVWISVHLNVSLNEDNISASSEWMFSTISQNSVILFKLIIP